MSGRAEVQVQVEVEVVEVEVEVEIVGENGELLWRRAA